MNMHHLIIEFNENIVENSTYLHIFGEVIVHVQVYGSEVSRIIELEGNFNGTTEHAWRVVSPTDPFVSWNGQEKEMEKNRWTRKQYRLKRIIKKKNWNKSTRRKHSISLTVLIQPRYNSTAQCNKKKKKRNVFSSILQQSRWIDESRSVHRSTQWRPIKIESATNSSLTTFAIGCNTIERSTVFSVPPVHTNVRFFLSLFRFSPPPFFQYYIICRLSIFFCKKVFHVCKENKIFPF